MIYPSWLIQRTFSKDEKVRKRAIAAKEKLRAEYERDVDRLMSSPAYRGKAASGEFRETPPAYAAT